jgi:hypothetical protein
MPKIPQSVIEAVQNHRASLVAERERITAPIDRQIAEVDEFLSGAIGETHAAISVQDSGPISRGVGLEVPEGWVSGRAQTRRVIAAVREILSGGATLSRPQIYAALVQRGVDIRNDNPERRLVQILSANDAFENVRGEGWRLANWPVSANERKEEGVPADFHLTGTN